MDFLESSDQLEIIVDEKLRPRVLRSMGLPVHWDQKIDRLNPPKLIGLTSIFINLCRWYRMVRPSFIGNRCAFEPSCSRYSEMVFRLHGFSIGMKLTFSRLQRCRASEGGLDLPANIESYFERNNCNHG